MINQAHLLTIQAANSLLKVLEEPPAETMFILLAEDLNKLPITIQSRCQLIPFAHLTEVENPNFSVLALTSAEEATLEQLFAELKKGGYKEALSWAEVMDKSKAKDRNWVEMALEWLTILYRDRLIWLATGQEELLLGAGLGADGPEERIELGSKSNADLEGCFKALEELNKGVYSLKNNGNYRLTMEALFINLRKIEQKERGV